MVFFRGGGLWFGAVVRNFFNITRKNRKNKWNLADMRFILPQWTGIFHKVAA